MPGADRTLRMFGFLDAGNVWGEGDGRYKNDSSNFSLSDLRYSVGLGVAWISPMGPLKLSIAVPLNEKEEDEIQRFQFQIGTGF